MISLRAAILRELIRLYTYPYRKRHMSMSRSVKLKSGNFTPPRGLAVRTEVFGGVRTEVTYNPSAENAGGNIIHFHGGGTETSASDCEMICARAAEAGTGARYIKFEGMWHDFLYMFPKLKESREAWNEIKKFICGHIKI